MDQQTEQPDSREQFLDQSDTKPKSDVGSEIRISGLLKQLLGEMEQAGKIDKDTNAALYQKIGSALKVFYKEEPKQQETQQPSPPQQQAPQQPQPQKTATEAFHEARRLKLKRAYHFNQ